MLFMEIKTERERVSFCVYYIFSSFSSIFLLHHIQKKLLFKRNSSYYYTHSGIVFHFSHHLCYSWLPTQPKPLTKELLHFSANLKPQLAHSYIIRSLSNPIPSHKPKLNPDSTELNSTQLPFGVLRKLVALRRSLSLCLCVKLTD